MRRHSKFFGSKLLNRFALITFLGCISLFSVGFSSWAFVKQTTMGVDVNVNVSDVVSVDYFNITNIEMFTLGSDGLVEDYTIVNSSKIVVNFTINNEEAYKVSNSGVLLFEIIVSCSNESFLSTYIDKTPTIDNSVSVDSTLNGSSCVSTVSFNINESGTTSLSAKYQVIDKGTINTFYSNLPTFNFRIRLK